MKKFHVYKCNCNMSPFGKNELCLILRKHIFSFIVNKCHRIPCIDFSYIGSFILRIIKKTYKYKHAHKQVHNSYASSPNNLHHLNKCL